jgi:hypothetical protein
MQTISQGTNTWGTPLEPDAFTFVGFNGLTRGELRKISRLVIRNGSPGVTVVENGIFDPGAGDATGKGTRLSGGVFDADGTSVVAAGVQRRGGKAFGALQDRSWADLTPVAEDVIYLGPLFNHYGRVLLETLARAWYLSDPETSSQRVIVSTANGAQHDVAPWLAPLLHAFGVPSERLHVTTVPTRFRHITVPEPLFEQLHSAHPQMVAPFRQVAHALAGGAATTDQPVYLSRRALGSRQRPVIGEAEVEEILRANGVRIVYPETMSLADQVQLFNTHRDIFSPVGSAAHSILFATNRPRLHLLASRDDIPANYYLCSALAEAPTTFVNCVTSAGHVTEDEEESSEARRGVGGRGADPYSGHQSRPQKVDLEAFVEYLRTQGFLRRPYRSLSAREQARLDAQFDEAWAYARVRKAAGKSSALAADVESQILEQAATSWPVSLMLAHYFSRRGDAARAQEQTNQFLDLLSEERDEERLRYFRADVMSIGQRLVRKSDPAVSKRLQAALETRWSDSMSVGDDET